MLSQSTQSPPSSPQTASPERPLKKLPELIIGLLLFTYLLVFLYRAGVALLYPYGLEYGEGQFFYEVGHLYRNGFNPASLYLPNDQPPYLAGVYSPLFYYLQAATMTLTGPTSVWGGRLLAILASFAVGVLLYRVCRSLEIAPGQRPGPLLGLAAALTPFATIALYSWGVIAKADMAANLLGLSSVALAWRIEQSSNPTKARFYLLVGLLCALTLFTKQSLLAAPAAIFLWLCLRRRGRELLAFCGGGLLTGGPLFLFFQITTNGHFYKHIVTYNTQPYVLDYLLSGVRYLVGFHFGLILLAGLWLVRPLFSRAEPLDLWRVYFLAALAVSFTIGKSGSNQNYYIESLCLASLLSWWQIARWLALRPSWQFGPLRVGAAKLALGLMAVQLFYLNHFPFRDDPAQTPLPAQFARAEQVAATVRELAGRGPFLAEDCFWQAALGLPVEINEPFGFGHLARQGVWDDRPLLEKLRNGHFRTVLFQIYQEDMSEESLERAVRDGTARPLSERFDPKVEQVLLDRTKFVPYKRVDRWLFLVSTRP